MSLDTMAKIIERASTDAAFRAQIQSNPESALAAYDLTADEKAALVSGDAGRMQAMGLDARTTKFDGSGSFWENQNTSFASGD